MEESYRVYYNSPIGQLKLEASDLGITKLKLAQEESTVSEPEHRHLRTAITQLNKYFDGDLKTFDVSLDFGNASRFYKEVWNALLTIPYGTKASYKDLAIQLGKPKGSQAVGQANGKNPIAIIVPCHRIIGSDGSLTGYASGLDIKRWLLTHELENSPNPAHLLF